MSDAPDSYNKSYCDAVVERLEQAVQNALKSTQLSVEVQRDFTKQSLTHINASITKAFKNFEKNELTNKELKKCITKANKSMEDALALNKIDTSKECKKTRVTMYGGAIAGILLYMGSQWAIITYIITLMAKYHGVK